MSTEAEDVWAIVRERDGLRTQVRRLQAENRRLKAIVTGYTDRAKLKPEDAPADTHRSPKSVRTN